jgi:hypothetical protein
MKALSKGTIILLAALVFLVIGIASLAPVEQTGKKKDAEDGGILHARQSYARLPMSFEPNLGQSDEQVSFLSRGSGYNLFLTPEESVLVLRKDKTPQNRSSLQGPPHLRHAPSKSETQSVVRMRYLGADSRVKIAGTNELPGRSNYLNSRDPGKWRTDIAQYAKVEYHDIYPGIDLVYYGNGTGRDARLEHDFVVRPGGDPTNIRLGFEGVERVELDESGDLLLWLPEGGKLIQHAPALYQESGGEKKFVEGGYVILGSTSEGPDNQPGIGFRIAEYDPGKTLYIDPQLSYSTYLGGSDYDFGYGIAVDTSGCAYVTGWTYSTDFPTRKPIQSGNAGGIDVFVAKLNASGNAMLYSTYVGGSGDDFGTGIAVDGTGAAYVTGYTDSQDFPTTAGAFSIANAGLNDAFVFKINAAGTALVYSTYLGGSGDDFGAGIAVASSGVAYVTGYTASSDFPTASPFQSTLAGATSAFVAEVNATGTALTYSTYLGGTSQDYATAIAIDGAGLAYVTGYTNSTNFPTSSPYQAANAGGWDAFVSVFNAAGSALKFSTYFGGTGDDFAYGIAVKADVAAPNHLCAYITGSTSSSNLPIAASTGLAYQRSIAGNYDAFVSKLDPTSATLDYSTYLGGEDFDAGNGIVVDAANNAYIVGQTWSQSFPVTGGPFQQMLNGLCDGFVTKLNPAGNALSFSSYLGGSDYDAAMGVALDNSGNLYLTGYTFSTDFPVVLPITVHNSGSSAAFIAKIGSALPPLPDLTVSSMTTPTYGLIGQKISVTNTVENIGVGASPPCKLGLYLSTTNSTAPWIENRKVFLGSRTVPSLAYNSVSTAFTSVLIPPTVPEGSYYLLAVADSGGVVQESNKTNNTASKTINIYPAHPDLIGTYLRGPSAAKLGQTVSISGTVKNQGYATAKNFSVGIYLCVSPTTVTGSDTLIGSQIVSSLAVGNFDTITITTQIPLTLSTGVYYIGMIVNNGDTMTELNYSNNIKMGSYIVISP